MNNGRLQPIPYQLENTLLEFMDDPEIIAVVGPRQAGKTITTYHTNKTTELVKAPKGYFYDTCTAIGHYAMESSLYEDLVFSELNKRGYEVKYYRTKVEIDFIVNGTPIELKYSIVKRIHRIHS